MRSMTTAGLFSLVPLGANPLVPSGPLGWRMTTILAAPRAFSSMFIVFSLEMRRSGRWDVLQGQLLIKYVKIIIVSYSPEFPDTACGMFSSPLVCNNYKLNFISNLENLSSFNLGHVKEKFLSLVLLIRQESKLAYNRNINVIMYLL